jgi:hypothetical protein
MHPKSPLSLSFPRAMQSQVESQVEEHVLTVRIVEKKLCCGFVFLEWQGRSATLGNHFLHGYVDVIVSRDY